MRPPWDAPRPPLADVVIDPGMAFGTAQHPTTRACLELLAEIPPQGSLLDAGCGSGVLAIAARRLGFDPVWAVNSDPLAVGATLANERRNRVGLRVGRRTIGADALPAGPAWWSPTSRPRSWPRSPALSRGPRPAGWWPRGCVRTRFPPRSRRFAALGLSPSRRIVNGGWATVLLERA